MRLRDLCNGSTSFEFLTTQNQTAPKDSEAFICTLSKEKLHAAEQSFRANLSPLKPLQVSSLAPPVRVCYWNSDIFCVFQSRDSSLHFQNCLEAIRKKKEVGLCHRSMNNIASSCHSYPFCSVCYLQSINVCGLWFSLSRGTSWCCTITNRLLVCLCVLVKCCILAGMSLDISLACCWALKPLHSALSMGPLSAEVSSHCQAFK